MAAQKAKCEGCETEIGYVGWPKDWFMMGISRYGDKYEKYGCGWWCPDCFPIVLSRRSKLPDFIYRAELDEFNAILVRTGNVRNGSAMHNSSILKLQL